MSEIVNLSQNNEDVANESLLEIWKNALDSISFKYNILFALLS